MGTKLLHELAKTIRSKNAGTDKITFDIIFKEKEKYELVRQSGVITKESISALYKVPEEKITDFVHYDPANAIKFTILRDRSSGDPGDGDIFGSQQYPPLLTIEVPTL
ncbi:DUF4387 domain-containing protein [Fictibacillus phosphorivorans]|uniref:DUF4387 domain-containing protein n=1 Tax=Fictibacillus phosphorivorans TaxID=1221500 RepID=UPI00203C429A|nr:DUF4387 domain-containing protein [Fictibacillus phosphorivorans]MCM3717655.1 DUF4387 domain-containing protein [Fictibacillus phosphorivorans]MCM3775555.1 DUF4387 domain-containing protein [Fictibacillus phosphorivorans]